MAMQAQGKKNPILITVEPKMLRWMRERANFDVHTFAHRVGTSTKRIYDWEVDGELTLRKAEKVADVCHLPFGYLYLDNPPDEKLPINDFRTVGSMRIKQVSIDLREIINTAIARQDWYRLRAIQDDVPPFEYVGSLQATENVKSAALKIRKLFDLETSGWTHVPDWKKAFDIQRQKLEYNGILVMRSSFAGEGNNRPLSVDEFRGFAIADDYAPLIFINGKDYQAAQMFTLMHELVHIWLGTSGISNLNRTYTVGGQNERFCNAVAAEILVPEHEIRVRFRALSDVSTLVSHFKVSRLVILRRLLDLKLIKRREFLNKYNSEIDDLREEKESIDAKRKEMIKEGKKPKIPYYKVKISRLGKPFVSAILVDTFEGRTAPTEAFHLLGVKSFQQVRLLAREMRMENF